MDGFVLGVTALAACSFYMGTYSIVEEKGSPVHGGRLLRAIGSLAHSKRIAPRFLAGALLGIALEWGARVVFLELLPSKGPAHAAVDIVLIVVLGRAAGILLTLWAIRRGKKRDALQAGHAAAEA